MKRLQQFGLRVVDIQANIILGIVYILIVPIFAFIAKRSRDEKKPRSGFYPWNIPSETLDDLRRQH